MQRSALRSYCSFLSSYHVGMSPVLPWYRLRSRSSSLQSASLHLPKWIAMHSLGSVQPSALLCARRHAMPALIQESFGAYSKMKVTALHAPGRSTANVRQPIERSNPKKIEKCKYTYDTFTPLRPGELYAVLACFLFPSARNNTLWPEAEHTVLPNTRVS